jgi:hypothetical protein
VTRRGNSPLEAGQAKHHLAEYRRQLEWGVGTRWCFTAGTHGLCCIGKGGLMEQHLELPEETCGDRTAGVRLKSEAGRLS